MDKKFIICLLLLYYHTSSAQFFFNQSYDRDNGFYYFSSLIESDNKLFVLAHFNDPSVNSRYGSSAIVTLNLSGAVISIDTIHPSLNHFYAWPESIQLLNDSILYYVSHDTTNYHAVEFNLHSKKTKIITNENQLGKFLYLNVTSIASEGNKYFVTNHSVRKRKLAFNLYWAIYDMVITKLSPSSELTKKILSNDTFDLVGWNIKPLANHNLSIMGYTTNFDYDDKSDYAFQQIVYEFDTSLNLVGRIISPINLKLGLISDLVETREGKLFCATSEVNWVVQPFGGGNYYEERPAISSYDSSGNIEWVKSFVTQAVLKNNRYNSLCFDEDSTHIIVAGGFNTKDDYSGPDSSRQVVDKGIITKIDLNGNLLWNRLYLPREEGYDFNRNEYLNIKKSLTGGYLLCGSSDQADKQQRVQKGWVMKLDEEGCLIPGCNLVNISNNEDFFDIKIYPTPATNYISIIHGYYKDLNLELFDLNGNLIKQYKNIHSLETNIISIGFLNSGEYLLYFKDKNGLLKFSKKISVLH